MCVNIFIRKRLKTGVLNLDDDIKTTYILLLRIHENMMHMFSCIRNIPV